MDVLNMGGRVMSWTVLTLVRLETNVASAFSVGLPKREAPDERRANDDAHRLAARSSWPPDAWMRPDRPYRPGPAAHRPATHAMVGKGNTWGRRRTRPAVRSRFRLGALPAPGSKSSSHGDTGWADCVGRLVAGVEAVPVRITSVLLRAAGQWKIIQTHISIGVPNEHMFDPMFRAATTA
jgi:hypothetical protein